jgi:hypothetical protein
MVLLVFQARMERGECLARQAPTEHLAKMEQMAILVFVASRVAEVLQVQMVKLARMVPMVKMARMVQGAQRGCQVFLVRPVWIGMVDQVDLVQQAVKDLAEIPVRLANQVHLVRTRTGVGLEVILVSQERTAPMEHLARGASPERMAKSVTVENLENLARLVRGASQEGMGKMGRTTWSAVVEAHKALQVNQAWLVRQGLMVELGKLDPRVIEASPDSLEGKV